MKILAVETSAVSASAALCEDDFVLGEYFTNTRRVHSQTLMPMVEGLLKTCGVAVKEVGLFAVASGPGSFTGVRIGVSAVKGMAMVRGTPCAVVSPLEAAAYGLGWFEGTVCAVMDARCGQFYNAMFRGGPNGLERLTPDRAIRSDELLQEIASANRCILVGDGARICYNSTKEIDGVAVAPENLLFQRASSVGLLGLREYLRGRAVSAGQLKPCYLRLPQAERERLSRISGSDSAAK